MLISIQNSKRARGFSLIELCIVVVILGITLSIGLPAFQTWLQNTQLRTSAETVMNGIQLARTEAVRRNRRVEFILSNPGVAGGTGWTVQLQDGTPPIQSKPNGEGTQNAVLTVFPNGATTLTFNGFGRTETTNRDASVPLAMIDIDTGITFDDKREWRINVTNGVARMCDRKITTAGDPRKC
ncbi:MAG: Tfp pilus assembly protein FimT [Proteobacteria bacterium]|nr:Tfp pilus assembly protein FimT [Pseudomonadota bacterium]